MQYLLYNREQKHFFVGKSETYVHKYSLTEGVPL